MIFEGRCWKFGDNIPTDRLVKSRYVFEPMTEIVKHVLEDLNPGFPLRVEPGDIVVAGMHFGQSSGRAIAAKALRATGIGCVVAETFARTFYRNCFEVGLPALEVAEAGDLVRDGEPDDRPAGDRPGRRPVPGGDAERRWPYQASRSPPGDLQLSLTGPAYGHGSVLVLQVGGSGACEVPSAAARAGP